MRIVNVCGRGEGEKEEEDDDEEEEMERGGGERGRDFVTFQQRNLEAEVRTLNFENL